MQSTTLEPDYKFLTSKTVVLNLFVEWSQIQTYDFIREPH